MLVILPLLFCSISQAQQEKRFLLYDSEDGLSNNNVHAITRTSDGLVWLGTQDGLCSFDGNQFTVYKHNESDSSSISDQFVLYITEDKLNNLWVGTRSGINYFNRKTRRFKRFYLTENEKHVFQSSYDYILLQQDNRIILKSEKIVMLDAVTGRNSTIREKRKEVIDWLIMPDYSGWSFNTDHKVYYYPDTREKENKAAGTHNIGYNANQVSFRQLPLNDSVICLYNFTYADTIYLFNKKKQSISEKIPVLPGSTDVCTSGNNFLLCNVNGLYQRDINDGGKWVAMPSSQSNGLPSSSFLSAYADADGNIWLGSAGAGVAVNNPVFELFRIIPTPVANERINGICISGNTLYAGTYSGLYSIPDLSFKGPLQFKQLLAGKYISAVTTDRNNNIWAAVLQQDVLVLSPSGKIIRSIQLPEPHIRKTVFNLTTSSNGQVLAGTSKGFFVTDSTGHAFRSVDSLYGTKLLNSYILGIFEDDRQQLWLAGYHGIDVLSAALQPLQAFKSFRDNESFLKRTIITSVTQDKKGAIWIATIRNGVYRYANGKHTHYTHADGLPSDITFNITCDNNNRIWVCTSAGLSVFDASEETFRSIPAFDGISKMAFSLGSMTRYNNQLIFGANGKLLIADADRYLLKKQMLSAYVSDVKINGQSVNIAGNRIDVMPDNKLIQFEFAYSPAFQSGNVIYQYRMKGIDSNWITLTTGSSSISYTGLPYRNLLMEVRAAGAVNGLDKAPVFSLAIHSAPPFFKTNWFLAAMALLLVALGSGILLLYNRRKFRRQLELLRMEKELHKERTRIGRDLHDNIGAYTSALIAGLNRIKPADEIQQHTITDLREYGSSIMGLLRETIWMLNAEELTVTAFADRFINYAMRINSSYPGIDMEFEGNTVQDKKLQPAIMLNLFRILQEALHNACKHSNAGKIIIRINSGERLEFSIADNGKGFNGNAALNHYGIDNMRERAAEAGFELTIHSIAGKGTTVTLLQNTANA